MRKLLCSLLLALPLAALAGTTDRTADDAAKALVDTRCVECHARITGGEANRIYARAESRVTTASQLQNQIHTCNSALKKPLFPEEEAHLAAYLNSQYYHFKQ
jgi:mono/diheme cytochrome c family protein